MELKDDGSCYTRGHELALPNVTGGVGVDVTALCVQNL